MSRGFSRRTFLRTGSSLATLGLLAACAGAVVPEAGGSAVQATVTFYTNDVGWREDRYRSIIPGV